MGTIVAGFASTHALTFLEPGEWDDFRARIAAAYERRYGQPPSPRPEVLAAIESETLEANAHRYKAIRDGVKDLGERIAQARPDVVLLVGDDQNENFPEDRVLPQIAVFTGDAYTLGGRAANRSRTVRSHAAVASAILAQGVGDGFDVATVPAFAEGALSSHAHYQIVEHVIGALEVAAVPVFVNALHQPAPSPARCVAFGESLARAVAGWPEPARVVVIASGGLSHFTSGYPWKHYTGPHSFGSISVDFDRWVIDRLRAGDLAALRGLTSQDLLDHGDIELRSWLVLLGALGPVPTRTLVYEPFYRGLMGMAVAGWDGPTEAVVAR
ncbi:MAG: extradiol ring-cleavage dioxygenase [Micromonosporaceae bacterium]|nr:extradiol ring-cleavage dioxygenase [Micromonosporaceae bacterium]